jgi:hypothetical protein
MFFNRISAVAAVGTICVLGACSAATRTTTVESGGEVTGTVVTPVNNRTLPAGARLDATLDQTLGTSVSNTGDPFTATVANTLYASDGSIVVPAGARIEGTITGLDPSNNAADPAVIRLNFDHIRFNGNSYPFSAAIVSSNPTQTSTTNADKTRQIVIGGAVGAALGGLLSGGDLKKIVIGGAVGAAAGSLISLGTDVNATLPAGSMMTVQATQTIAIR